MTFQKMTIKNVIIYLQIVAIFLLSYYTIKTVVLNNHHIKIAIIYKIFCGVFT